MNLPKFIIVKKETTTEAVCDACNRAIKHTFVVKNTQNGTHSTLGSGCVEKVTEQTVKQLYSKQSEYDRFIKEQNIISENQSKVQEFKEANPDMMKFIEDGATRGDSFLIDMKKTIETKGTLTQGQYAAVYTSMLDVKEIDSKVKDLCVTIVRVKTSFNAYGETVTLFCETEDNKLVRVYFSGWTESLNNFFLDNKLFDTNGKVKERIMDIRQNLYVSGTFDGYKIKRAKIRNV